MLIDVCATEIISTFNSKLTLIVLCATQSWSCALFRWSYY